MMRLMKIVTSDGVYLVDEVKFDIDTNDMTCYLNGKIKETIGIWPPVMWDIIREELATTGIYRDDKPYDI